MKPSHIIVNTAKELVELANLKKDEDVLRFVEEYKARLVHEQRQRTSDSHRKIAS